MTNTVGKMRAFFPLLLFILSSSDLLRRTTSRKRASVSTDKKHIVERREMEREPVKIKIKTKEARRRGNAPFSH